MNATFMKRDKQARIRKVQKGSTSYIIPMAEDSLDRQCKLW